MKTRCPYCGKKLGYFQAFIEKKRGEHTCSHCGRNSTIFFSTTYKVLIVLAILLAVALVIISINPYFIFGLWGMLWVAVPFVILYIITPFFLKLVPIKKKSVVDVEKIEVESELEGYSTRAIDKLDEKSYKKGSSSIDTQSENDDFLDISELKL